jgi:hypothetical protein
VRRGGERGADDQRVDGEPADEGGGSDLGVAHEDEPHPAIVEQRAYVAVVKVWAGSGLEGVWWVVAGI